MLFSIVFRCFQMISIDSVTEIDVWRIDVLFESQVRIFRTVATAFMAHHGATIAEHGLEKLGLGACGKVNRMFYFGIF